MFSLSTGKSAASLPSSQASKSAEKIRSLAHYFHPLRSLHLSPLPTLCILTSLWQTDFPEFHFSDMILSYCRSWFTLGIVPQRKRPTLLQTGCSRVPSNEHSSSLPGRTFFKRKGYPSPRIRLRFPGKYTRPFIRHTYPSKGNRSIPRRLLGLLLFSGK